MPENKCLDKKLIEKYNIFEKVFVDKKDEQFFEIFKNETIKVEKIVSNGQKSPENFWYEQEKSEYILLLSGSAILEFEDFEVDLKKGDCLNIKAMQKHRVKFTSLDEPTIWFAVFYWGIMTVKITPLLLFLTLIFPFSLSLTRSFTTARPIPELFLFSFAETK